MCSSLLLLLHHHYHSHHLMLIIQYYYSLCFIILICFVSILGVPLRLLVFLLYLLDTLADPYAIIIHLPGYIENELIKDIIKNDKYKI